jgi:hypothetical protein
MSIVSIPRRPRRISRLQAFSDQGVTLKYPSRSWSGLRFEDGAVVIALRESEVEASFDGFRCLLWAPVIEGATEWVDRPVKDERLQHCRLALVHGGADGLLVGGSSAEVDRGSVVTLRVEKLRGEYWAFWGSIACTPGAERLPAYPGHAPLSHGYREPVALAA